MRTNDHYAKPTDHRAYKHEIMDYPLRLALLNANGLAQHAEELRTFISYHKIDVMLISETHFTEKKLLQITLLLSLPHKPSSLNRPWRKCNHKKKLYPA
jgi:hypothetical protein